METKSATLVETNENDVIKHTHMFTNNGANIVVDNTQNLMKKTNQVREMAKVLDDNGNLNISVLTDDEKRKYRDISRSLTVSDINSVSNYGSDLQNTMNKYSNEFLSSVRTSNTDEIGGLIVDLLTELEYIDVDELKKPNFFKRVVRNIPLIKNFVTSVETILKKYDTISNNVDKIAAKITATRFTSLRDNNALQHLFNSNKQYSLQIDELIIAGKLKLSETQETLNNMIENQNNYQSYEIRDVQDFIHNLEKRLSDMITLKNVIAQSLHQIRLVQRNNIAIADKADSIVSTTIPVWRNQLSIAVALQNQKKIIEVHRKVSDATNTILKKNAETLKLNTIEVARENERSVVDIETLRLTTSKLIETINEVKRIHEEGANQRREAENEILRLEKTLDAEITSKNKLISNFM